MTRQIFKLTVLISLVFLMSLFSSISVQAGTSHGVNGYVSDCDSGFVVSGANVTFQLVNSTGSSKAGNILNTTIKANLQGWYTIDVGNFDGPWLKGYVVLINVSKGGYHASTNVILTEAGNDQAFTVCLGPSEDFTCACGNDVCEYWKPLCENDTFEVRNTGIFTKRCPEDCANCTCGNDECQRKQCGEDSKNCPKDCGDCDCGNKLCQQECGENMYTCPEDCGYYNKSMPSCGNGICEPQFGENLQTCPADCYGVFATCGDKKCTGAEDKDNCCIDCGCPDSGKCKSLKCINNRCRKTCCLFGYCCVWLKLCWFWWVLIIILIIAAIIIYLLTRQNLKKIIRKLASITKLKTIGLAEKAKIYEKWK
jgi:hypothetical protein